MRTTLLLILSILLFTSCSEYQRVLKNDDTAKKYSMMNTMYENGKYKKALKLMEQIVPAYRGKPQAEKLMFMYANTFYNLEDFYLAGYQFERFATSYPKSDSVEIASFKGAQSYYELSSRFSLDQEETYKGLEKLQSFIDKYPDSELRTDANAKVAELNNKLEKKSIETAKQYLRISDYKAAIESFDNFILDNPGSVYRKNAYFGKFEAAYRLAINSFPSLVKDRLITAKGYYNNFAKYYGDSDLKEDSDKLIEDVNKRLNEYKTETSSLK
ncbi:MAG: outer membrane protein assembly factor BamD [Flavobacteriaceae bacterium]|nr:outer membrane protein assembly factor BamD [Flavobacteriaceae bacterium]